MTAVSPDPGIPRVDEPGGGTAMEALEFRHDIARYLLSRAVFAAWPRRWSAHLASLRHVRLPRPRTDRPGWMVAGVRLSGICGSDLAVMTARESLYLEPEATYPFVPGHEIVGEALGARVAVCPVIGCRARGLPLCPSCATGWVGLCARRDEGWPGRGLAIGFNRDTGGGWAEACLVHVSQLWQLPDSVTDADALLLDPASAALAALLRTQAPDVERTLVIGGGTIGMLVTLLHRTFALPGVCELLVRYESQRARTESLGVAASVVADRHGFESWAAEREMRSRRVAGYGRVYRGVFDRVIDCAGTAQSFTWATAAVRPRGRIALVAAPGSLRGYDPTPLWYREIAVQGIHQYGPVPWHGEEMHAYDVLIPSLASGALRMRDLVTHVFPLANYVEAFDACVRRRTSGALKVAFRPEDPR